MNIFGEGFSDEIVNQIRYRRGVYGSGYYDNRTDKEILYLNSRTGWCRLVSGVDIKDSKTINNPTIKSLGLSGPELASLFILHNGTESTSDDINRGGINYSTDILAGDAAYGIGGTEFGIQPMMGIISADIKHENRGSLRTAKVKIKAFNRVQFEIIDALYLRLGFSVLLEWGHSIVINSSGDIETDNDFSLKSTFLDPSYTYDNILTFLRRDRLKSSGNYDGMLGKVVNFNWSFNADGSYDITLDLRSVGDVIESLKVNILTDSPNTNNTVDVTSIDASSNPDEEFEKDIAGDIIDTFAYSSNIGNFLYACKKIIDESGAAVSEPSSEVRVCSLNQPSVKSVIDNPSNGIINFNPEKFISAQDIMTVVFDDLGGSGIFTNLKLDDVRYYVRLGTFLQYLEKYIIPTVYNKQGKGVPSIKIDYDSNTNIMLSHPWQVSVDPRICYVNRSIEFTLEGGKNENVIYGFKDTTNPFINETITSAVKDQDIVYGNIMNIYLEMTFILKKIIDLRDDKGNLSLIDFLQGLMEGVNEGLGGINDFDVFIDETLNMIKIVDKNPLPYEDKVINAINANYSSSNTFNGGQNYNTSLAKFELYGYKPFKINQTASANAGFIYDFNLTTEMTPAFANMITAGAAAVGSVVGENETALSKLNNGFDDRYKHAISNSPSIVTNDFNAYDTASYNNLKTELDRMRNDYSHFLYKLSNGPISSLDIVQAEAQDIENFKATFSSLVQKSKEVDKAKDDLNAKTTTTNYYGAGFIPFNFNFSMDGLSGIKINQQFLMDTSFLPTNYPDTLKFLIKNLSHEIKDNKWSTKIETYCVPKAMSVANDRSVLYQNSTTIKTVKRAPVTTNGGGTPRDGTVDGGTAPAGAKVCPDKTDRYGKTYSYNYKSVPSGYCVKSTAYSRDKNTPKMIFLHYTAGPAKNDNGASTIDVLNNRAPSDSAKKQNRFSGLSSHKIIDGKGHIEQMVPDNYIAYCQGNWNYRGGLSVEIQNLGWLDDNVPTKINSDGTKTWYQGGSPWKLKDNEVAKSVDWNGKPLPYRGHTYWHEFNDAQIVSTKNLILEWQRLYNIPWQGKGNKWGEKVYKQLFPPSGVIASTANANIPGIYTHGSVSTAKTDIQPTPKIIAMLKSL